MEFVTVTPAMLQAFASLLPADIAQQLGSRQELVALGAVEGQTPCGVLVAALEPQLLRLVWLCTAEQARGRGVARALVRKLLVQAWHDPDTDRVMADVRRGAPVDPVFMLLLTEGWQATPFALPDYGCTLGQLAQRPFWKQSMRLDNVCPLGEVPPALVQAYSAWLSGQPAQAAVELPLRLERYDPVLSMGYVSGGQLQAVLLAEAGEDGLVLAYAQARETAATGFARLVYAAGQRAMEIYPPETRVSFAAITPAAELLAKKLLPAPEMRPMYRMSYLVRNVG